MYFEDSLWLSEGTLKNIVGIAYCVCGKYICLKVLSGAMILNIID